MLNRILLGLAVIGGWLLSRKYPRYKPTAKLLTLFFFIDSMRFFTGIIKSGEPRPFIGIIRFTWAVDTALVIVWYISQSISVWISFSVSSFKKSSETINVGIMTLFFVTAVFLHFTYLLVRGRPIEIGLTFIFIISLAFQLYFLIRFTIQKRIPNFHQTTSLILIVSSVADLTGPWLMSHPSKDWFDGRLVSTITWIAIFGWELRCLISLPKPPDSYLPPRRLLH